MRKLGGVGSSEALLIKFQSPQGGSKLELLTFENVVDLEDEEATAASRTPARRLAAVSTSRAATPAKRRLGLGGPRLGAGPVQAQSPSKRLRLSQATEETTPKVTRAASAATFHGWNVLTCPYSCL